MSKGSENRNCLDSAGLVSSSQTGIHPQLEETVRRHFETKWLKPLHQPTIDAYQRLLEERALPGDQPFILDSGCGTGKSTQHLAGSNPGHIVIGVDQSISRLAKSGVTSSLLRDGNCILLRAELSTFWRLLVRDGYSPERHYLLYPNPWPKPGHLARRWHGHPVFPQILLLGGEIEMRCNWEIYALEFAQAMTWATGETVTASTYMPDGGISLFEQKYLERGQALFRVLVPARDTNVLRHSNLQDCL